MSIGLEEEHPEDGVSSPLRSPYAVRSEGRQHPPDTEKAVPQKPLCCYNLGRDCDAEKLKAFVIKNFLVLGFAVAILWALTAPAAGAATAKITFKGYSLIQTINIIIIFLISGVTLKTDDIKQSLAKDGRVAFAYGVIVILFITSCAGFIVDQIPFNKKDFAYGLAVFTVVPTTLSTGVALVTNAKGNAALALLLCVVTNLLGVVTIPFMLKAVLQAGASIDAVELLQKLVITLLVPLVVGKVAREAIPGMKGFVSRHKLFLGLFSNFNLVMIVWQTVSKSADKLIGTGFLSVLTMVLAGVGLHLLYLSFNYPMAKWVMKLKRKELKAVVIMCSQKTLPVTVTVLSYLTIGDEGLMAIPCIIAHISQIFIDAYIVSGWSLDTDDDDDGGTISKETAKVGGREGSGGDVGGDREEKVEEADAVSISV